MPSEAQTLAGAMALKPEPNYVQPTADVPAELREYRRKDGKRYFDKFCPEPFKVFDLEHPTLAQNVPALASVVNWDYQPKGMLLSGPTGKGKSRACWQLLNKLYAGQGNECRWYHAMDFFTELNECIKYGRDDAKGWISDVAWRRVVFIDDWGQEANTKARADWAQSWFFRFLDYRLERQLPVIITTNLSAKEIAYRESDIRADPLLRRLLEICTVIKFK